MTVSEVSDIQFCHGVFVECINRGVLITGNPGVGKSTLALKLVADGSSLIADDLVRFARVNNMVYGQLPNNQYAGLMHLRQSGFLSVNHLHKKAVKTVSPLEVIISLDSAWQPVEKQLSSHRTILGINVPFYSIHTSNTDAIYSIINSVAKMN